MEAWVAERDEGREGGGGGGLHLIAGKFGMGKVALRGIATMKSSTRISILVRL